MIVLRRVEGVRDTYNVPIIAELQADLSLVDQSSLVGNLHMLSNLYQNFLRSLWDYQQDLHSPPGTISPEVLRFVAAPVFVVALLSVCLTTSSGRYIS